MCTSFREAVNIFQPLATEKDIELSVSIDKAIPHYIEGDPGRFAQIVTNLVGNAIKFTAQGSVSATLRYEEANAQLYCCVRDTGIGIPQEKHRLIFEKFTQGDVSISRRYGGTGLGLAITKQLVRAMGGTIEFESREGEGSKFWFTLPVTLAEEPMATNAVLPADNTLLPAHDAHILIAEDHPVNQQFLVKLLTKFGFRNIIVAEDGIEALSALETRKFDAIFMDCHMPKMDGYQTTRHIRQQEETTGERTFILATTADVMAGTQEACLAAGMDSYINKPIDPEKLKTILSQRFSLSINFPHNLPPSTQSPVNLTRFHLTAATPEETTSVLALFFELVEEKLALMENLRRSTEQPQWRQAAHYIKGSAANLGMEGLATLCKNAELRSPLSYKEATLLLRAMRNELDRIRSFFTDLA